ncbi:hypothetical protein E3N88_28179 [Mikania micrantha]|uniref:Uncharacterized protein n=1 Tax=Mikania micrantha TaxID=192012 RepID=A0A5N6MYX1_9ASTR|nr:hypothetical protein E3N88_28179 [Mikania micrantha]
MMIQGVGRSSQGAEVLSRSQSRRAGGRRAGAEGRGLRTEQRGEASGMRYESVGRSVGIQERPAGARG